MTKHLLKLNEIEDQFRELTNKFEEVNFKLDKLSTRVTKIQSDNQLRFSDLEKRKQQMLNRKKTNCLFLDQAKPQDFGAAQVIKLQIYQKNNQSIQLKVQKQLLLKNQKKESLYFLINQQMSNMNLQ